MFFGKEESDRLYLKLHTELYCTVLDNTWLKSGVFFWPRYWGTDRLYLRLCTELYCTVLYFTMQSWTIHGLKVAFLFPSTYCTVL